MIFIANWKMNGSKELIASYSTKLSDLSAKYANDHRIIFCPPFPYLGLVQNTGTFALGGQDCSALEDGSHTAQVSAQMLRDVGCSYVIIGHSETRERTLKTDGAHGIPLKLERAFENKLTPIFCVGEPLRAFRTSPSASASYIRKQLKVLKALQLQSTKAKIIVAYEPIWAIGTGFIPEVNYLESMLEVIREYLPFHCSLLYGGSVNKTNIDTLKEIRNVDGFILGKCSIDIDEMSVICTKTIT